MKRRTFAIMVFGGLVLLLAACGGSGEPRATPLASATPEHAVATGTAAPGATAPVASEQAGAGGFRVFAAKMQEALDAQDAAFFQDRVELASGICTDADVRGGIGAAPCTRAGDPWEGFPAGYWRSEGAYLPPAEATSWVRDLAGAVVPEASDQFGGAELRVYALNPTAGAAVITAIIERPPDFGEGGPLRVVRVAHWSYDGTRWRLKSMLVASVLAEEFLIPCPEGLTYFGGEWERYPDRTAPPLDESLCPL